ncbi:MAG TPA: hypothetical protein VF437_07135 [Verrucomicrobiae bacterium]|jgi:uncharacterized membrane protein
MDTTTPPTTPAPTTEDKTVAILSYLTLIGFIVAIVMHSSKKTRLGAFHLRQVLGLMLTAIAGWICVAIMMFVLLFVLAFMKSILLFLIPLIYFAFGVSMFVLWLMGFIAAINGQMNPMPVVGPYYQKWFGTAFE